MKNYSQKLLFLGFEKNSFNMKNCKTFFKKEVTFFLSISFPLQIKLAESTVLDQVVFEYFF